MVVARRKKASSLYDVLLAGTHDSAAYSARPDLLSRTAPAVMASPVVRAITARVQAEFALTQKLTIAQQLAAGARFLDLRVSKRADTDIDTDTFWTVHGMVLCVPLDEVLQQLVHFHNTNNNDNYIDITPVVLAVRTYELTQAEVRALGTHIIRVLGRNNTYIGCNQTLADTPLDQLPPFILAGVAPSLLGPDWGVDVWTDTYNTRTKISFLEKSLHSANTNTNTNRLLVLGWTVTPNVFDVVLRCLSFGTLRRTVLEEAAVDMNNLLAPFIDKHRKEICEKVNVFFFDSFEEKLAQIIADISPTADT